MAPTGRPRGRPKKVADSGKNGGGGDKGSLPGSRLSGKFFPNFLPQSYSISCFVYVEMEVAVAVVLSNNTVLS